MPQIDLGQVVGPPGQDGADGQDGAPGAAAAITGASASATTLSAGSAATAAVTANGTDASRSFVFSFGIPKGDKGDTGAAGPSNITTDTATNINGVLKGNGSKVSGVTVDSEPDAAHTGNLISSAAVADALAEKTGLSLLTPYQESTNTASRAYVPGDSILLNGNLYVATAFIAANTTLATSTNIRQVTVCGELSRGAKAVNLQAGQTLTINTPSGDLYAILISVCGAGENALYYAAGYSNNDGYKILTTLVGSSNVSAAKSGASYTVQNTHQSHGCRATMLMLYNEGVNGGITFTVS